MICRKCGREITLDVNFCPYCGEKIVVEPAEEGTPEPAMQEEKFDFHWNLDDFNRSPRTEGAELEWGDLLGTRKEGDAEDLLQQIEAASKVPEEGTKPMKDFVLEPAVSRSRASEAVEEIINKEKFDTFNQKTKEFQELLEKEQERIRRKAEEKNAIMEELGLNDLNEPIPPAEIEELPEEPEKMDVAERLKMRREARNRRDETQMIDPDELKMPLKVDEDDFSGQWPLEPDKDEPAPAPEVEAAPVKEEKDFVEVPAEPEPVKVEAPKPVKEEAPSSHIEAMAAARKEFFGIPVPDMPAGLEEASKPEPVEEKPEALRRRQTQQISRDEFAAFLKKAEEQFGFDSIDEAIEAETAEPVLEKNEEEAPAPAVEEPAVEEQEAPAEEVEAVEEAPAEEEPKEEPVPAAEEKAEEGVPAPAKKKTSDKTGEFKLGSFDDDIFWEDEKETEKGSGCLTAIIVILLIILMAMIAIMVIRFQFPDSAAAQIVEPIMAKLEDFIRGIFN